MVIHDFNKSNLIRLSLVLAICIVIVLTSCGQAKKHITINDLKGSWYLNKWTAYHTLVFSDNTIFVDNNIDTVFSLHYSLSLDTLITWNDSNQKFKNRIFSISKDSLILNGIGEVNEIRSYSRSKVMKPD